MNYIQFYNSKLSKYKKYHKEIEILNDGLTYLFYGAYPILFLLLFKDKRIIDIFLYPAISFFVLSVFRSIINRKRPYEMGLQAILQKNTKGHSMPSRHVFSATIIAMCYVWVYPIIGYILLGVSFLMALLRVLAGVHYLSDVIVGYLIGIIVGLYMIL